MSFRSLSTGALLGALLLAANTGHAAPAAPAPNSTTAGALTRWQAALDQLSQGHRLEAKVLLEQARARYGDAPEINMLLAWLAERDGQNVSPLLAPVARQSKLAMAWSATAQPAGSPVPVGEPQANRTPLYPPGRDAAAPAVAKPARSTAVAPQSDNRMAALEAYMVNRVNDERRAEGLKPLITDSLLADTARAHSNEMRDKQYFAHESPTAGLAEPLDRYRVAFGETPSLVAENIYRSWGAPRRLSEKDVDEAHASLMKSPGHRANIVLPNAARIGIGLSVNAAGDLWVTQMFARG